MAWERKIYEFFRSTLEDVELCQLPPSPPHLLPPLFLFLENEPGFLLDDVLGGEVRFGGAWKTIGGMMEMKTTVKPNSLLHQRRRTRDLIYLSSVGRLQLFTLISERQPHTPPPPDEPLFSHRKRKERKMQTKINQKKKRRRAEAKTARTIMRTRTRRSLLPPDSLSLSGPKQHGANLWLRRKVVKRL